MARGKRQAPEQVVNVLRQIELQKAGWQVGKDSVERIWRREGLMVPQKQKPLVACWLNDGSCVRLRPEHQNHLWSYDFVSTLPTMEGQYACST